MLTVKEPAQAREWLGDLARQVTTAERKSDDARVNVAFTATGLRRLGLSDTQLAVFPYAFRDGMASTRRARVLGDVGDNAPATWHWGGPEHPVDVLLLLFARDVATIDRVLATHLEQARAQGLAEVVPPLLAGRQPNPDSREHFGFNDGIGQPAIRGAGTAERQE